MLSSGCRLKANMAPTASWTGANGSQDNVINFTLPKPKRVPVSILKKADSDTSSTCSNSSMVTCKKGCKLKVLNIRLDSHDCFERLRQELNDSYGKIDDLEEQLKLQGESHQEKEQVLRKQIKRLRVELGGGDPDDVPVGEKICVKLTRENRTFGFKLLGRVEGEGEEDEDSGVSIASLTLGCPAQKSGKIFIRDQILEINSEDVTSSTCKEVESLIRNSPDTMSLVLIRTSTSRPFSPPSPTTPTNPSTTGLPTSLTYQPVAPPRTTSQQAPPMQHSTPPENHSALDERSLYNTPSLDERSPYNTPSLDERSSRTTHSTPAPLTDRSLSSLPRSLPLHFISDEDFDRLSAIGLPEIMDSSQDKSSELTEFSLGGVDRMSDKASDRVSDGTDITDIVDIMGDAREYEDITLMKQDGMLGITLTYGADTLQGALFVDSIRQGSPADIAGKPLLHDQILKINEMEVGVDVMCDGAIALLTDNKAAVSLELARPKKHEVRVRRKVGQSLGMMVAVSKVEDDKSVIISTVDPSGLVAKYGLFKGLTLEKVNDIELSGLGLKQAVEILAACVGEITLTVFVHPNFSPYQPPRPPTPYPLRGQSPLRSEDEIAERSVKFSLPASPARSNSIELDSSPLDKNSISSSPRPSISSSPRPTIEEEYFRNGRASRSPQSTPSRGRSPSLDDSRPRILHPFPRGYGSPSMNLINNDWSLDRSLTSDTSLRSLRSVPRDVIKGPVRVSHQVIPSSILPLPVSLHKSDSLDSSYSMSQHSPTPYPSLNTYENVHPVERLPCDYENIVRYPDYKQKDPVLHRPSPRGAPSPTPSLPRPRVLGRSPQQAPPSPGLHKPRVLGRRERAAMTGDRKVQFGGFKPINPMQDDEHYV